MNDTETHQMTAEELECAIANIDPNDLSHGRMVYLLLGLHHRLARIEKELD